MKTTTAVFGLLATASAVAISSKVSYDGYKVFRVPSVSHADAAKLEKVTADLGLQPWQTPFKKGTYNDIAVPPSKLSQFHELVGDMNPVVMHEDLGHAINEEGNYHTYAGEIVLTLRPY